MPDRDRAVSAWKDMGSIDVSGAKYGPLGMVSHDPGFGPGREDGLLGRDFLDNFAITIDNAAGLLTLSPR